MKILQINKFYYLRGGSERYMFEASRLLAERGHTVIPFAMQDVRNAATPYAEYFAEAIDVHRFSLRDMARSLYDWVAARQLQRLIEAERPDIAHLHNIDFHLTPAIIRVLKKNGIPMVQTLHDYKLISPNRTLFCHNGPCRHGVGGRYYRVALHRCIQHSFLKSTLAAVEMYLHHRWLKTYTCVDRFIAPSEFMRQLCIQNGVAPEKIVTIRNFVTLPSAAVRADDSESVALVYVGRLSPEKGVGDLLAAVAAVPAVTLRIVGDGPERSALERVVREGGLSERVHFTGTLPPEAVRRELQAARALVLPSRWEENMPLSLLEAMAAGTAVVAPRAGGIPEVVRDGENGILFESRNVSSLVMALRRLLAADVAQLGLAARRQAEQGCAVGPHIDRLEQEYLGFAKK